MRNNNHLYLFALSVILLYVFTTSCNSDHKIREGIENMQSSRIQLYLKSFDGLDAFKFLVVLEVKSRDLEYSKEQLKITGIRTPVFLTLFLYFVGIIPRFLIIECFIHFCLTNQIACY